MNLNGIETLLGSGLVAIGIWLGYECGETISGIVGAFILVVAGSVVVALGLFGDTKGEVQ